MVEMRRSIGREQGVSSGEVILESQVMTEKSCRKPLVSDVELLLTASIGVCCDQLFREDILLFLLYSPQSFSFFNTNMCCNARSGERADHFLQM